MPHLLKFHLFLFILIICFHSLHSQTHAAFIQAAKEASKESNYYASIAYYQKALEKKEDPQIRYQLAIDALSYKAYGLALDQFQKVNSPAFSSQNQLLEYYTGLCYFAQGNYELAKAQFQSYIRKKWNKKDRQAVDDAREKIKKCDWSLRSDIRSPLTAVHIEPFSSINSDYSDFGMF